MKTRVESLVGSAMTKRVDVCDKRVIEKSI